MADLGDSGTLQALLQAIQGLTQTMGGNRPYGFQPYQSPSPAAGLPAVGGQLGGTLFGQSGQLPGALLGMFAQSSMPGMTGSLGGYQNTYYTQTAGAAQLAMQNARSATMSGAMGGLGIPTEWQPMAGMAMDMFAPGMADTVLTGMNPRHISQQAIGTIGQASRFGGHLGMGDGLSGGFASAFRGGQFRGAENSGDAASATLFATKYRLGTDANSTLRASIGLTNEFGMTARILGQGFGETMNLMESAGVRNLQGARGFRDGALGLAAAGNLTGTDPRQLMQMGGAMAAQYGVGGMGGMYFATQASQVGLSASLGGASPYSVDAITGAASQLGARGSRTLSGHVMGRIIASGDKGDLAAMAQAENNGTLESFLGKYNHKHASAVQTWGQENYKEIFAAGNESHRDAFMHMQLGEELGNLSPEARHAVEGLSPKGLADLAAGKGSKQVTDALGGMSADSQRRVAAAMLVDRGGGVEAMAVEKGQILSGATKAQGAANARGDVMDLVGRGLSILEQLGGQAKRVAENFGVMITPAQVAPQHPAKGHQ